MAEINRELILKVLDTVDAGLSHGLGNPVKGEMCVEAAVCFAMGLPHSDDPGCVSPVLRSFKIALNDSNWSSPPARAKGLRRLAIVQLGSNGVLDDVEFSKRLAMMTTNKVVPRALRAAASMKMLKEQSTALEEAAVKCEQALNWAEAEAASDAASYAASDATSYAASDAARAASDAASDAASYAARSASYAARAASDAARAASDAARAASDAASDAARAASDAASYAASYAARSASYAASDAASYAASDLELSQVAEDTVQILISMGVPGAQWLALAPLN